jgi:hypothetical protein
MIEGPTIERPAAVPKTWAASWRLPEKQVPRGVVVAHGLSRDHGVTQVPTEPVISQAREVLSNGRGGDPVARLLTATLLACLWVAVVAAGDVIPGRTIDLDQPGALEALQRSNPTHYETIQQIMDHLPRQPDAEVPHWIQATFHARDATYGPILLTSFPPKRRVSFTLDDTRYEALVTLTNWRGENVPAK